ncbi:MAG: cytochrome c nitrite reductase small subunit [Bacteroidetes bacterium]|nr:cytochrome c nitrite reductase small subunit [Bacteroidota bacterium]
MRRIIQFLTPPLRWRIPAIVLSGFFTGFFLYIIFISKAVSYISDDPKACVNCHIMSPEYATWNHSSHRKVCTCNDCHVPQDNFLVKYLYKAKDGMKHATYFTLRLEPQVILIEEGGQDVVQKNCLRCHKKLFINNPVFTITQAQPRIFVNRRCWDCHAEVPHGKVHSLSSVPYARVPFPSSPIPEWLNCLLK